MKVFSKKTYLLFLLLIFSEMVALYSIKKYKETHKNMYTFLAILGYMMVAITLIKIVEKNDTVSLTNVFWNVLSSVYGLFIGYMLFKEKITRNQFLGVMLAIISIVLINGND